MHPSGQPIHVLREQFDRENRWGPVRTADIAVYRRFVAQNDQLLSVPEVAKSDELAISRRADGNQAFSEGQFDLALLMYNQSICYAETRSEQLGFGFANRSAVYYRMCEYEFALYNINLARKHSFPERLMSKLEAREMSCKNLIAAGHSKGTVPHPMVHINVEVNPKIPFLAEGIGMKQYMYMGRGLEAQQNFDAGDVILDEKVDLCSVSFEKRFSHCAHCGSHFLGSLIPCAGCVIFMYCGEECREKDYRNTHRFECSVISKLSGVTDTSAMMMARLFFYGLTAFNDDVDQMMKCCSSYARFPSSPLDQNFTSPNPSNVFKVLFKAEQYQRRNIYIKNRLKLSAAAYHRVFMKNQLVQAIFRTKPQRKFMLRCMVDLGRTSLFLTVDQVEGDQKVLVSMPPIATLMNHSCDPNAVAVIDSGRVKVIVMRPVRRSDQITISYGKTWWGEDCGSELAFDCKCVVCDRGPAGCKWRATRQVARLSIESTCPADGADSVLDKYQRKVQKLARSGLHPGEEFGQLIKMYERSLVEAVRRENEKLNRAKVV